MLNALNPPELRGYELKSLPKARAVNLGYFEGILHSRQTLPGQGSGFLDVEPVHERPKRAGGWRGALGYMSWFSPYPARLGLPWDGGD